MIGDIYCVWTFVVDAVFEERRKKRPFPRFGQIGSDSEKGTMSRENQICDFFRSSDVVFKSVQVNDRVDEHFFRRVTYTVRVTYTLSP